MAELRGSEMRPRLLNLTQSLMVLVNQRLNAILGLGYFHARLSLVVKDLAQAQCLGIFLLITS
jgi:hypothetical protein